MSMREVTAAVLSLFGIAACARTVHIADGPIALDSKAREISFNGTVASGPSRELCLEFETPNESHAAGGIHVSLVRTDDSREAFVPTEIDRRGEALVCLCNKSAPEAAAPGGTQGMPTAGYRAAVLWSKTPVQLRQIRWWSGPV